MGTNTGLWIRSPFPLFPQLLRANVKVFAEFDRSIARHGNLKCLTLA